MLALLPEEYLKSARMHVLSKTEIENPIQDLLPLWVMSFPKSSGRRNACSCSLQELWMDRGKRNPSPSSPLSHHHPKLSLWVERSFWNRHTHTYTHKRFPSDLPASSCPSFLGSWSCWDTGVGEIPSPLCSPETKWIKWTRFWRSLRSHRGEGRDGERSWGWRRKGRARNSVTQVVCATCTSVPLVRKQECSYSPWDNVPVWYPLLVCDRRASYSQPLPLCFLWKILVGEVQGTETPGSSFINLPLLVWVAFCTFVKWGEKGIFFLEEWCSWKHRENV